MVAHGFALLFQPKTYDISGVLQMIIEALERTYRQVHMISRFPPFYIGYFCFMAEIAAHNWR